MTERPSSHDFLYVHTDIPEGMAIGEWRAARAVVHAVPLGRSWRGVARALAWPRIARIRMRGGWRRAPRPAAPPTPGATG
jgi:hypothetical protein